MTNFTNVVLNDCVCVFELLEKLLVSGERDKNLFVLHSQVLKLLFESCNNFLSWRNKDSIEWHAFGANNEGRLERITVEKKLAMTMAFSRES